MDSVVYSNIHLLTKGKLELHYLGVWDTFDFYDCFWMNISLGYGCFNTEFAHKVHNG